MKVTEKFFKKLTICTIVAVYFLILVGGIVRSTGSGMGCPDWPRCFGSFVPPVSESQLPTDYQEHYLQLRLKKNQRIAKLVSGLGFSSLADEIVNDPSIRIEEPFNATKTWIEYINRLIGVLIGLFIFAVLLVAFLRRKQSKALFYWALISFIMVAFQGWFGSIVVSTNLLPGTISVHMGLAMLLVCILIYMVFKTSHGAADVIKDAKSNSVKTLSGLALLSMVIFLVQIFLGTQVRESIDLLADRFAERSDWVSNLGLSFYIHRTYSLLILGLQLYMTYLLWKINKGSGLLRNLFVALVSLIVIEILTGAIMAYFSVPAVLQPLHLLVATLIFGLQFYTYLKLNLVKDYNPALT